MIRLALRQFRTQLVIGFAFLVVVGVVLAITGAQLAHLYDTTVAGCQTHGDCSAVDATLVGTDQRLQLIGVVLILIPGIVGVFWGAPLVARELENNTHRLVWTQSVTRTRWIAAKLSVVGVASVILTGLLSWIVTWWFNPIDKVNANQFSVFDERGIVPIAYTAFAFVLGAAVGVVMRRTVLAMAVTVVVFIVMRLGMTTVMPYLISPAHTNLSVSAAPNLGFGPDSSGAITFQYGGNPTIPNALVLSSQVVDAAGRAPTAQFITDHCPAIASPPSASPSGSGGAGNGGRHAPGNANAFNDCITQLSTTYHEAVTYQPADRYWTFQWFETAIFAVLAVALSGFCVLWVRRRLS